MSARPVTRPREGAEALQEAVRALQGARWELTPRGRAALAAGGMDAPAKTPNDSLDAAATTGAR